MEVDTRIDPPTSGDVYLLCSDGLTDMLCGADIAALLLKYPDLTRAAAELVDAANERGGVDNITVVLVRWLVG